MDTESLLENFFEIIRDDPRIGSGHISLYTAMLGLYIKNGRSSPMAVSRQLLMKTAKVFSRHTYNRTINDLKDFGYINYIPARNLHFCSYVFLLELHGNGQSIKIT